MPSCAAVSSSITVLWPRQAVVFFSERGPDIATQVEINFRFDLTRYVTNYDK